jgi:hypothetical protein
MRKEVSVQLSRRLSPAAFIPKNFCKGALSSVEGKFVSIFGGTKTNA